MLPELSGDFRWIETGQGPALVCGALEPFSRHFFTTRTWTLGATVDDERTPGWEELAKVIGVQEKDLVRARQVHGSAVVVRRKGQDRFATRRSEADILVSDDPSVALAVQTADCVPLLIADRRTGSIAAAHAGWRGLAARVPSVAVEALGREFDCRPDDLVAAIGPSISAPRYEVGGEVRIRFEQAGFQGERLARWFSPAERPGHWFFDGWRAAQDQLAAAGVGARQVHLAALCTASHPDVFCSYRRDGKGAGRIAGAIRARGGV